MQQRRVRIGWVVWVACLLFVLASAPAALAQRIPIDPPYHPPFLPPYPPVEPPIWREPPPVPAPIRVDRTAYAVQIDGTVANVTVRQTFVNETAGTVEGQFIFPLPSEAVVGEFQMRVDDRVLEGQLLPEDEAQAIYARIVRQRRDPALLRFLGNGLFQTNVFPIPPGETREVALTYVQVLERADELLHFRLPLLTAAQPGTPTIDVQIELSGQPGLRTIYSPNAGADILRLGDDAAVISYSEDEAAVDPYFELFWGRSDGAIGADLLSYQPTGEEGYFALLVAPSMNITAADVVPRDVVLVLDVSGSMEGDKIEQARAAAAYLVDHLNPEDRFNLIAFSTGVRLWREGLTPNDADAVADAYAWIEELDAGGSTDINRALLEAMAQIEPDGEVRRPTYVLFVTDGLPTQGVTDPWRIIDNVQTNAPEGRTVRLFTFGVGYDVNTILLDALSQDLGGRSDYVLPEEAIDEAVGTFLSRVQTPVLADVGVEIEGDAVIDELYPFPLPDLFAGEQLVVVGRYRGSGPVDVLLSGTRNGREETFSYSDLGLRERGGEPFVARLWASRKIGVMMAEIRRHGPDPELVDAIVELSLRYGIVTPYTAYLVEEPVPPAASVPGAPVAPDRGGRGAMPSAPAAAAGEYAAEEAARVAEMPESGAAAVAASEAQNAMQTTTAVRDAERTRFAGGKTFVQQGMVVSADGIATPLWVDTTYGDQQPMKWVLFGSDEYFELAEDATTAEWLSVGAEVVVVMPDDTVVRVTTNEAEVERQQALPGPVSPLATPEAESSGDNAE